MKRLSLSKKVLSICLSLFIAAGGITGFVLHASKNDSSKDTTVDNTAPSASFGLSKKKKADIVFTTGSDNNFNSDDFNNKVNDYVKNRLVNSGVDTQITSMTTSTQSITKGSFSVNLYWPSCGVDLDSHLLFYSNGVYQNQVYYHNKSLYGCTLSNDDTNGGTGEWTNIDFSKIPQNIDELRFQAQSYKGSTTADIRLYQQVNGGPKNCVVDKSNYVSGTTYFGKLVRDGDTWDFIGSDNKLIPGNVVTVSSKTFSNVLKEPTWRDNTHKFVVNLSEDAMKSIVSSSNDYPTTLSTMLSNKEYFLGVMNSADKATVNSFINQNDEHGTYIGNSNIDTALNAVTDYILKILNQEQDNSNIFLVGDEISYNETYKDNENDKKNDELWKYEQDNKHLNYDDDFVKCSQTGDLKLDNDLGVADFATGQWMHRKVSIFDKPGKYKVSLKVQDNPTATDSNPSGDSDFSDYDKWSPDDNSVIINVHRKPTAVFTAYAVANASTGKFDITVKDEDKSYDIDHQNTDGARKGIVNKKFQWKEVTNGVTDTWHDGKLPSPQASNKDFLVKLSVQDLEGQWSDDLVKYVTTKNENLPPVAQFVENETEMPVDQLKNDASTGKDVIFTDQSYDPNGDSIRETWIVKDSSGNVIYNSSIMPTASIFIGKPLGTYTISLVCDDGPTPKVGVPLTSDPYVLQLKLVPINHKPIAHFEINNTSKEPENIKITEDSTDPDGDPIDDRIWTVTDSSGNVVEQTENKLPDLNILDGTYTLTLKVKDNPKIPPELWSDPYSQQITVESLKLTGTLYPNPVKQGQQITLDITTQGKAKYLRAYFPIDIVSRDKRGTSFPIQKEIPEEDIHNEKVPYILPIDTPLTLDSNGNRLRIPYSITVEAEKASGAKKSITLYLDVQGNVVDGVKSVILDDDN